MKKILLFIIFFNFLYSAEVKELLWPKGETFLTFLEKYKISQKLYYDMEKEDRELCSEIVADRTFYLYENDNGTLNQVLIPISDDIQLHVYVDVDGNYKFQTLPISYTEYTQTAIITINNSISVDVNEATLNPYLASMIKQIFASSVNFRGMQKGDNVIVEFTQKEYLGKNFGMPEINAAMVEVAGKQYFRFKNDKDDKYYDQNGIGFTKTYPFKVPLTYSRISSQFTKKRWHPVLKRYRAHLGTDFAAPRGRKIYASGDGRIEFVGTKGGYGKTIIINHGSGYKTLYAHQSKFSSNAKRGRYVKQGTLIGYVGNTGLSSGPHLHFGFYKNGVAMNGLKMLKQPKTEGLTGKEKAKFVSTFKPKIEHFNSLINDPNKPDLKKFARTTTSSDIAL